MYVHIVDDFTNQFTNKVLMLKGKYIIIIIVNHIINQMYVGIYENNKKLLF